MRVARRDFDKAAPRPRRARGRDGARRGGGARRLAAGARGQRLRALRALPGAQHRAAPALQRVLPRGRAPLRPAARRLRAGHAHRRRCATSSSACATASSRSWPRRPEIDDALLRVGPFPEAGQRALLGTVLRAIGVDERAVAPRRGGPPVRGDASPATDVRLTTRYDEADLDSLYCVAARVRPRALRAPDRPRPRAHAARRRRLERLARVAEPAVGEHGRALGRLLALVPAARAGGAPRALRRRDVAGGPARGQRGAPELHPRQRRRGHLRPAHRPALRARAGADRGRPGGGRPARGVERAHAAPISASTCPTTSTACCRTSTGPRAPSATSRPTRWATSSPARCGRA